MTALLVTVTPDIPFGEVTLYEVAPDEFESFCAGFAELGWIVDPYANESDHPTCPCQACRLGLKPTLVEHLRHIRAWLVERGWTL